MPRTISTMATSVAGFIGRSLGPARDEQADQPQQGHGADERHEKAVEKASAPDAQEGGEGPAAHEGASDPDDEDSNHAVAVSTDQASRQRDDDEPDKSEDQDV